MTHNTFGSVHPGDDKSDDNNDGSQEDDDEDDEVIDVVNAFDSFKIVCHEMNMYQAVRKIHREQCHCKTRGLERHVKAKFARIPRWVCELVCTSCSVCNNRIPRKNMRAGHTPILIQGFGTRGQCDLIDLQVSAPPSGSSLPPACSFMFTTGPTIHYNYKANPDGESKFLLTYLDLGSKLCDIRCLTSKRASACAAALLSIFSSLGIPALLQTDNGGEFRSLATMHASTQSIEGGLINEEMLGEIVSEVAQMWPGCKLVHGRARHSESQGGIERLNRCPSCYIGAHWEPARMSIGSQPEWVLAVSQNGYW